MAKPELEVEIKLNAAQVLAVVAVQKMMAYHHKELAELDACLDAILAEAVDTVKKTENVLGAFESAFVCSYCYRKQETGGFLIHGVFTCDSKNCRNKAIKKIIPLKKKKCEDPNCFCHKDHCQIVDSKKELGWWHCDHCDTEHPPEFNKSKCSTCKGWTCNTWALPGECVLGDSSNAK